MPIDNMKIWADNWKTDPKFTKKVNQRGGYTAIDAQYKLERVTAYFGACGIGWGFAREFRVQGLPDHPLTNHVVCDLLLWYKLPEDDTRYQLPSMGSAELYHGKEGNYKADTDAWKKAETDALTKAFSRLGFFADVFLGMFDDDKYVEYLEDNPPKPGSLREPSVSKPTFTLINAQSRLENAMLLVPENETATSLAASASLCFEKAGLGERFMERVCAERGFKWDDHGVAVWLWERGIKILDTEIKAFIAAGGDPDADWMYHAKQVAQLADETGSAEVLISDASLPLFERQP